MATTILLVEDDLDVRFVLEHVLLGAGYHVTAVETIANAVKLVSSRPFDLVIADGKLPDGTGLAVADKAAEHDMKTLIITGNAFALPQEQLQKYAYLLKPLRPTELLDAVRRMMPRNERESEVLPFPKSS